MVSVQENRYLKKTEFREKARKKRAGILSADQGLRTYTSERVRLVLDDVLKDISGYVAGYRSQPFEVDLDPWLIARPLDQLCFPVVNGTRLDFYRVESWADFKVGPNKILEPLIKPQLKIKTEEIRVFLVPGLCFDRRGFRLGSGQGFYDRTLVESLGQKIGVSFSKMVYTENIPNEPFDVPMDWVVTEDFVFQPTNLKGSNK